MARTYWASAGTLLMDLLEEVEFIFILLEKPKNGGVAALANNTMLHAYEY
jgi:hypothetical protein